MLARVLFLALSLALERRCRYFSADATTLLPLLPQGTARIRVQISAAHEREHLDAAISAFKAVGREMGVI